MSLNKFIQEGRTIQAPAPAAVAVGELVELGASLVGVAMANAASGDVIAFGIQGVYKLPLDAGSGVIASGEKVNFAAGGGITDAAATTPALAGIGVKVGGGGDDDVEDILLFGGSHGTVV